MTHVTNPLKLKTATNWWYSFHQNV